jgi:hypothetical protein
MNEDTKEEDDEWMKPLMERQEDRRRLRRGGLFID